MALFGHKHRLWHSRSCGTGTFLSLALLQHWHSSATGTVLALALFGIWHRQWHLHSCGTGTLLALALFWHCRSSGTASLLALALFRHWHCSATGTVPTGTVLALAPFHHWNSLGTGSVSSTCALVQLAPFATLALFRHWHYFSMALFQHWHSSGTGTVSGTCASLALALFWNCNSSGTHTVCGTHTLPAHFSSTHHQHWHWHSSGAATVIDSSTVLTLLHSHSLNTLPPPALELSTPLTLLWPLWHWRSPPMHALTVTLLSTISPALLFLYGGTSTSPGPSLSPTPTLTLWHSFLMHYCTHTTIHSVTPAATPLPRCRIRSIALLPLHCPAPAPLPCFCSIALLPLHGPAPTP
ncbi:hypothetical protein K439DRAFT_1622648 [Ramaria rubella]|nr:hypothetical protein K439DRAFT_1622648 [Ramaria rubella]